MTYQHHKVLGDRGTLQENARSLEVILPSWKYKLGALHLANYGIIYLCLSLNSGQYGETLLLLLRSSHSHLQFERRGAHEQMGRARLWGLYGTISTIHRNFRTLEKLNSNTDILLTQLDPFFRCVTRAICGNVPELTSSSTNPLLATTGI